MSNWYPASLKDIAYFINNYYPIYIRIPRHWFESGDDNSEVEVQVTHTYREAGFYKLLSSDRQWSRPIPEDESFEVNDSLVNARIPSRSRSKTVRGVSIE